MIFTIKYSAFRVIIARVYFKSPFLESDHTMILSILSIFCYGVAGIAIMRSVFVKSKQQIHPLAYLAWAGLLFHIILLSQQILGSTKIDISTFKALSLTSVIMLLIILPEIKRRLDIALVIIPLSAVIVGCSVIFRTHNFVETQQPITLGIHIISSIAAYAILSLAATQAIFLYLRDKFLKKECNISFIQVLNRLPPLMRMEASLFRLLTIGFILLSISLISGLDFFNLWFTKPFIHKTILSLIAWAMFGSLLLAHRVFGLRGKHAIRWMLIAFVVLIVGFTGTRLIQEFLLNRIN